MVKAKERGDLGDFEPGEHSRARQNASTILAAKLLEVFRKSQPSLGFTANLPSKKEKNTERAAVVWTEMAMSEVSIVRLVRDCRKQNSNSNNHNDGLQNSIYERRRIR